MDNAIKTNVVSEDKLRNTQRDTLRLLKEYLSKSFGPYGSNTIISQEIQGGETVRLDYSKDGHTILKNIVLNGVIEMAVRENITNITNNTVKNVGDGTTSATILASLIFDQLIENKSNMNPFQLMREFKSVVEKITDKIKDRSRQFTLEDARDIAYISTNGNEEMSQLIYEIYEEIGLDAYIETHLSTTEDTMIKKYDGLVLDAGCRESAFINDSNGKCSIRNAKIYTFIDPIDVRGMSVLFDKIIIDNILIPISEKREMIPTVIMCPMISRDLSATIEKITSIMLSFTSLSAKPPISIIPGVHDGNYEDIISLCGAKAIRKYIDLQNYEEDVKNGLAPTPETIHDFAGYAELVESDSFKTKIIRPKNMLNEKGELSDLYTSIISALEAQLKQVKESTNDASERGRIRRRLQGLKCNLVDLYIGADTMLERDSRKYLVDDAVLNCRSASVSGVGYASNFEALYIINELLKEDKDNYVLNILYNAYKGLLSTLYNVSGIDESKYEDIIKTSINEGKPYDVVKENYNDKLLSSIDTDITTLNAVVEIVTLMYTSNQFICPEIKYNYYE